MLSVDTNILFPAMEATAPFHDRAREFLTSHQDNNAFVLCDLALVELYLLVRNPVVVEEPLSPTAAVTLCQQLRRNASWRLVEHAPVMEEVWKHASQRPFARRKIIDARFALTLLHHGVTEFATVNVRDFEGFGFYRVWNPLVESPASQ